MNEQEIEERDSNLMMKFGTENQLIADDAKPLISKIFSKLRMKTKYEFCFPTLLVNETTCIYVLCTQMQDE